MRARTLAIPSRPIDRTGPFVYWFDVWHRWTASPAQDRPDAATLRDLGLHPSEWDSIQAEAAGLAAATRRRVVDTP